MDIITICIISFGCVTICFFSGKLVYDYRSNFVQPQRREMVNYRSIV